MNKKEFESNVIQTWGQNGKLWLKKLPETIKTLSKYWKIENLKPLNNLSFNYVTLGLQNSKPVILKIGCVPNNIKNELIALTIYDGKSAIKILDYNEKYNALLLECAIPGTSLKVMYPENDDKALEITASIIKSLHSSKLISTVELPFLEARFKDLFEVKHIDGFSLFKALEIAQHLFKNNSHRVLLHGDLHHDNILLSERGYLAIDPHGFIGDPGFEVCAFIRNPDPRILKPKKLILHRINLFSEILSIDKEALHQWIYLNAVLEGIWQIKDGQKNYDVAFAEAKLCEPK